MYYLTGAIFLFWRRRVRDEGTKGIGASPDVSSGYETINKAASAATNATGRGRTHEGRQIRAAGACFYGLVDGGEAIGLWRSPFPVIRQRQ